MQKFEDSFDGKFDDCLKQTYKATQATKQQRIVINVAQTQYAVVKHVAKKKKWQLVVEPAFQLNFDLAWIDSHLRPQFFTRMGQHQKINHIPGMAILSRKNNLGKNLMLFRKKFPLDYDFFPLTWSLPSQYAQLNQYHENRQQGKAQTFIVKPQASCQGRGIFLTRHIDKLKHEKCVVQRYMHKPYLIDGLKFDLRIYVLVSGVDPLRIFIYEQGLARFATQPYRPPRSENLENKFMHLTNYAINKDHPAFQFNQSVTQMNKGHKRSLSSIYEHLKQQGYDVKQLKKKIDDILIKTIITGYPNISRSFNSSHPDNFGNDMCFQILGFDIMLDYKLIPTLIQVNYTPSFTADTPLDRHIKKKLIDDTLILVNVTEKWKHQMKKKRQKQIQERMVSGKRKKYSQEQRIFYMQQALKKRNQFEEKILNKEDKPNGFRKIFLLSQQQMKQYQKYYQFGEEIYHHSLTSGGNSGLNGYFQQIQSFQPNILFKNYFVNSTTQSLKNKSTIVSYPSNKSNQINSSVVPLNNNHSRIDNHHSNYHKNEPNKSRRISSAKPRGNKKKITYNEISSSKFLPRNDNRQNGGQVSLSRSKNVDNNDQPDFESLCIGNQSIFKNKGLKEAILTKKKKENIHYNDKDDLSLQHRSNLAENF